MSKVEIDGQEKGDYMGSINITIKENVLPYLQVIREGDNVADKANLSIIIGLFVSKTVTLEKAAELAGKNIWEFVDILKDCHIPWGEYTEDAQEMDELAMKKLAGDIYG